MRGTRILVATMLVVGCGGETVVDAGADGAAEASLDAPAKDVYACEPNGTVCTDCRCECCSGVCGPMEDGGAPGVDYCKYFCVQNGSQCHEQWNPCCPGQGVCDPVTRRCK